MLIGHNKQNKYFSNIIKNNSLSHAYLLSGPEMIGKKLFARGLYESLNGRTPEGDPDFKFITPKIEEGEPPTHITDGRVSPQRGGTKLYIEDIRDIKKFLSFKAYSGPYKVVVIDDAHRLTTEAANALLKALEEPSSSSVLFLVTHMPKNLPGTILSRCQKVSFLPARADEVAEFLKDIRQRRTSLRLEKLSKSDEEFLTKISFGRLGFIERLLQENGLASAKQSVDDLRKLLGKGAFEKIEYAKKVHENKAYEQTVGYWLNWLYANLNNSTKNATIVKNLFQLNSIVSQPQFNHRLALENFLLNL